MSQVGMQDTILWLFILDLSHAVTCCQEGSFYTAVVMILKIWVSVWFQVHNIVTSPSFYANTEHPLRSVSMDTINYYMWSLEWCVQLRYYNVWLMFICHILFCIRCGKTTLCQLFATLLGRNLLSINCHMHSEAADFLGGLKPVRKKSSSDVSSNECAFCVYSVIVVVNLKIVYMCAFFC